MTKPAPLKFINARKKISELIPASWNPRKLNRKQKKDLIASLEKFELAEVPVINTDNLIVAGHQRIGILLDLKGKDFELDVRMPEREMTEQEVKEYNIRSNKNTGEWDKGLLLDHFDKDELGDWGFDDFELEKDELKGQEKMLDPSYSQLEGKVIYEPKESNHTIADIYQRETKFDEDIATIEDPEIKQMLEARARNFDIFNFPKIADYYANQATPEVKLVMEKMALILLDRDQLIENGFSDLINSVKTTELDE